MTAIAGVVELGGRRVDSEELRRLAASVPGEPAEVGTWAADGIGLAVSGTPVTPESAGECQPLLDEETGCALVFDGRLDNRAELERRLPANAGVPPLASDARLVLAAYLAWGVEAPKTLLGDFALAVWDAQDRRVVLARDPMGIRPLYLGRRSGTLLFASTAEQLLRGGGISEEIDEEAAIAYLYAPLLRTRRSFYRRLEPLAGGELAEIRPDGQLSIRRYWSWPDQPPDAGVSTGEEPEKFRALFTDAVGSRLRSSTPVAILLSGGLDSGSVGSVAGRLVADGLSAEVRTYTYVFERFAESDERVYADAVVRRYGLANTRIAGDDCWTLAGLETWLPVFTEPFFGAFDALFHRALATARHDGTRVTLTGHAGDLLAGTPEYLASWLLRGRWRALHRELTALAREKRRGYAFQLGARAFFPLLPRTAVDAVTRRRYALAAVPGWMPPAVQKRYREEGPPLSYRGAHGWWRSLHDDLTSIGASSQNAYFDRLMRLFGQEVRQPMLDARLVDFILRTPPDAMHRDGRSRVLQREGLAEALPPAVRHRADKSDLGPLLDHGLRERRRAFVERLLHDSELERRGYVRPESWTAAMRRYLGGEGRIPSWQAFTLELWLRAREGRLPPLG
jgi:asparagine synthase (glutamine-hydrolysing)